MSLKHWYLHDSLQSIVTHTQYTVLSSCTARSVGLTVMLFHYTIINGKQLKFILGYKMAFFKLLCSI